LLYRQIFNFNGIAPDGVKRVERWRTAQAKLYQLTNGIGAGRAVCFRPASTAAVSLLDIFAADGIASCIGWFVAKTI